MTAVVILFAMGTNNADIVCVCSSAACGGKVELHTERRGVIYSPSWPLNYPPGVNCSWNIQGNRGDVITIRYIYGCRESHLFFIIMINYKLTILFLGIWDMMSYVFVCLSCTNENTAVYKL